MPVFAIHGWGWMGRALALANPPPHILHPHRHQSTYSSACYDLLEGLLCLDPARRLSAKAALNHEVR